MRRESKKLHAPWITRLPSYNRTLSKNDSESNDQRHLFSRLPDKKDPHCTPTELNTSNIALEDIGNHGGIQVRTDFEIS